MDMSDKRKSYLTIIMLCGTIILLLGYITLVNNSHLKEIQTLEGGWSFSVNGTAAPPPGDTLSAYIFPTVLTGDEVTLTRTFTEENAPNRMLTFDTWHSITTVHLDGAPLYTQGQPYADRGQMLGQVRHNIHLPPDYQGKTLTLSFRATEDNPLPYLTSVAFYEAGDPMLLWFNRPLGLLFLGSFFVFLGVVIGFIACAFAAYGEIATEQLLLGICVVLTGVYILSRGNFIQLLIPDPLIYNAIEYVSLFMLPIPVLLYWQKDALTCSKQAVRLGYRLSITLNIAFVVGAILLNFTTPIHLCQLLIPFYLLVLLVSAVMFGLLRFQERAVDTLRKKIYMSGIVSFILGAILSIVAFRLCYNTYVAELLRLWSWYNYILPASMCILVLFFSMAFVLDMKQLLEHSFRHEFLQYAAYSDMLTQLSNRRSFHEKLQQLEETSGPEGYGLISIDLNDLKEVNDKLGHHTGDQMLEAFAKLLTTLCTGGMQAYRLGGDEFAVIVTHTPVDTCPAFTHQLLKAVERFNQTPTPFHLSAAYGYATSGEGESPLDVFKLSDRRMYEKKREMKADALL